MKITKRQLKRIIREEKRKLFEQRNVRPTGGDGFPDDWWDDTDDMPDKAPADGLYVNLTDEQERALSDLEQALSACLNAGCKPADILDTASSMVSEGAM